MSAITDREILLTCDGRGKQAKIEALDRLLVPPAAYTDELLAEVNALKVRNSQLFVELGGAKAYSQQVVANITEEMNGLKAGNVRLLRELDGLRGLKPLLKRARDELKECIEGQDENPDQGSPRTTDEQRAVLNDLDAAMEASK